MMRPVASPILVRLAGLPAASMEPFRSTACKRRLAALDEVEDQLSEARSQLVDALYEAINGAPAERRHFLLAVKRDAYNGRPLAPYRDDPQWPLVEGLDGALVGRILALEATYDERHQAFETTYFAERDRERLALPELLDNEGLLRGLALASPVLVANVDRLRRASPKAYDRKARKQAESLLRYSSRAALKLSPYSTLTRVALGTTRDGEGALDFAPAPWNERSLMRLKRYSLNQHLELLERHEPFCRDLPLEVNNTVEELQPGRYRFLRMGAWRVDPETKRLSFQRDALVSVALGGALVGWMLGNLRQRDPAPTYRQAIDELAAAMADGGESDDATRAQVRQAIDQLLQVGFLRFRYPWPTNELHLERRLLDHLRELESGDPGLAAIVAELGPLVEHELGYGTAEDPLASVKALDRQLRRLSERVAGLETFGPGVSCQIIPKGNFFEDVFLAPGAEPPQGETSSDPQTPPPLLTLPKGVAEELLATARPLVRLAGLFDGRLELGLTLAAFMAKQWPDRRIVGLLEVFAAFQPLWKRFLEFSVSPERARGEAYDPLGLEAIGELVTLRQRLERELAERLEDHEGAGGTVESRIDPLALAELMGEIPEHLALPVGAALLVQPADAVGRRWVLNQRFKGIGRSGSRFTAVMDPATRRRYGEHLAARSSLRAGERRLELLDLMCVQGDTLNVHTPQTRWALELPGLASDFPAERRLAASELLLARRGDGLPPDLVDADGRIFLPAHLGVSGLVFMPTLIRFLSVLGSGEIRTIGPRPGHREEDGVTVENRLVCGRLVLRRRRWTFERRALPKKLGKLDEASAFAAIHRWRRGHDLPDRVYFKELRVADAARRVFKPQAVDFTSPGFVTMLRGTLESRPERLVLEEALPEPDAFPTDAEGRRWATELLLDDLAFAEPAADPEDVAR